MAAPKVTTRRAVSKRPREHDTGHVITGFGYAFECSCGEHGRIVGSYRDAMQAGREHAAAHTAAASPQSHPHTESDTRGETMAPREAGPAGDGSPGRTADVGVAAA